MLPSKSAALPLLAAALILSSTLSGCGGARSDASDASSAFSRPLPVPADALCLKGGDRTDTVSWVSIDGRCTAMFATMTAPVAPGVASEARDKRPLAAAHARFTWPSFLSWATSAYPQFFRGRTQDGVIGEYTYRYWPDTGHYLGMVDAERLYALGPATDDEILYVGTLGELNCAVYPANCGGAGNPPAQGGDIPGDRSSTVTLSINSPYASAIGAVGDEDWFAVDLQAGTVYTFHLEGSSTGKGSLADPYVRLHDSTGRILASNDDVDYPANLNARIQFTAVTSGRYHVSALGFAATGSYQLTATAAGSLDVPGDRSTTADLAPGATIRGDIARTGDEDWFVLTLAAGTAYTFNLEGAATGKGTLADPYLELYDVAGRLVASHDDVDYPSNPNARLQVTPTTGGRYYLAASGFSDEGTYQLTASGGTPTPPQQPPPAVDGRVAAFQPVMPAVAAGSISYRFTGAVPALSGSFRPSPDGFETEFTAASKLYRWIDKTSNLRLEAEQDSLTSRWTMTLYDDSRTELPYYPFGFGKGYGYPLANSTSDQVVVSVTRGTTTDRAIDIRFTSRSALPGATMLDGTLTGNAPHHLWSQTELPRSSSGTLSWNGISRSIVSTRITDDPRGGDPAISAYLDDGSSFTANLSGGTPPKMVQTRLPTRVTEFQCGPSLGGACDYTVSKNGSFNAVFRFSTQVWSGTSRTGPSTRFEGAVDVGQQYSTLTVNGVLFTLQSGNFGVASPSSVSSVADTTRFQFSAFLGPGTPAGLVAGTVNVWRRGNRVVQVQVPGPNGSQFICTETASDSRTNVLTRFDPAFTIPACPGVTALFPIGGNVRGFEFNNFRLNAAPSLYAVPLASIVLNGVLMAKGL